jgi:hypothetical protein
LADVTEHLSFWRASAMKYIFRAGIKNPFSTVEDLQKAAECIRREIKRLRDAAVQAGVHLASRPTETLWPTFPGATPPIETNQHGNPP